MDQAPIPQEIVDTEAALTNQAPSDNASAQADRSDWLAETGQALKGLGPWINTHKPEMALLAGMTTASLLVSGAALAVLLSPNLGQKLAYEPLIDDATLAASRRANLGEQLLGQVARVLEIEIVETQGPNVGHRSRSLPAMTIVAQVDQPAAMPEADLALGLKTMVLAAGVGLGITGLMRLFPYLPPLGPRRRLPLAQRLGQRLGQHRAGPMEPSQPFAPIVASTGAPTGRRTSAAPGQTRKSTAEMGEARTAQARASVQTLMPDALSSLPADHPPLQRQRAAVQQQSPQQQPQGKKKRDRSIQFIQKQLAQKSPSRSGWVRKLRHRPESAAQPVPQIQDQALPTQPQRPSQPISFVTLGTFSPASAPGKPFQTVLTSTNPPAASSQVKLYPLIELDMRRQYPLAAL